MAYIVTYLYLIYYKKTNIFFIFSDPPYIDRRPEFTKLAFARGAPATLICRASGYPEVDFTWFIKRGRPEDKMEKGQLISKEISSIFPKWTQKIVKNCTDCTSGPHGMWYLHFGNGVINSKRNRADTRKWGLHIPGQFWSIFVFIFGRIDTKKDIFWN